jgi:glycosyltransferase involved in cell wall biosynthesis
VVVTYRSPVFNRSEGFVQAQALGLTEFQPLVCGRNRAGPVAPELADRLILPANWLGMLRLDVAGAGPDYARRVAPWRPVLVHAHFATDGMAALPLAQRLDVPLVTSLRGYDVTRSRTSLLLSGSLSKLRYALFGRRLRAQGALFLAVCDFLRERAIASGFPAERTITHYNGVDLDRFRPGDAPEPGLVLHVARLAEKKGTDVLLRAFAAVRGRFPAARLVVIGDGPLRGRLRREAAQLGIGDAVEWLGMRPADEVAAWMRRAWALAVPSRSGRDGNAEGLPNVVVEAAASGLPVVASRHAGIPEAVAHGRSGLLVAEGAAEPLAQALTELLGSPDLRRGFARGSRALASERFDYRRQMQRLQAHYRWVIGRQGR